MPMHTVPPLIADTDRAVATFVIRLVGIRTAGLAGREALRWTRHGIVIRVIEQSRDRSIAMLIQNNRSGLHISKRDQPPRAFAVEPAYRAAIPFHLLEEQDDIIERVIQFAFDTLAMHRLELRVYDAD
jgi:hypothetical protein